MSSRGKPATCVRRTGRPYMASRCATCARTPRIVSGELRRRGYLAHLLADVFSGDALAQRSRLAETLRLVYGGPLGRSQIRDLFHHLDAPPTAALEAAVTRLASRPNAGPFIADQAALARRRLASKGSELV